MEDLGVFSPLRDDFDALSSVSDLNFSQERGSLLEFFCERYDVLLGECLHLELTLEIEVRLYDNYILQLEHEMVVSKEKERIFFRKNGIGRPKGI